MVKIGAGLQVPNIVCLFQFSLHWRWRRQEIRPLSISELVNAGLKQIMQHLYYFLHGIGIQ